MELEQTTIRTHPESNFIRIYLKYSTLHLADLRTLLNDLESVYRQLDSERVEAEWSQSSGRPRRFLMRVEQMQTGRSIETVLTGNSQTIALMGQLLAAIHSYWLQIPAIGASLLGAGAKAVKMRKEWLEGNKVKAEAEKTRQEAIQLGRENSADSKSPNGPSADGEATRFGEYDLAGGRLVILIDRVRRSPRIELMEIELNGQRFVASGREKVF